MDLRILALPLLAFLGCTSNDDTPCTAEVPRDFCELPCRDDLDCPDGSFCGSSGHCDAECWYMGREMGCQRDEVCSSSGVCE